MKTVWMWNNLLTYLLTYFMEQSPSWEANCCSVSKIPCPLQNLKVHYCVRKSTRQFWGPVYCSVWWDVSPLPNPQAGGPVIIKYAKPQLSILFCMGVRKVSNTKGRTYIQGVWEMGAENTNGILKGRLVCKILVICQTVFLQTSHILGTEQSLGISWGSHYVQWSSCNNNVNRLAPLLNCTVVEQQAVIWFLLSEGVKTSKIHTRMLVQYG